MWNQVMQKTEPPSAEILAEDLERIKELERRINESDPDFLIGLHLEGCLPEEANVEEIARIFANALSILNKRAGAHYKIDLNTLGLKGFANLYFVAPGMGGVFCYNYPLISEETPREKVCPPN
ncbi:MAG TPA: hypothetical protein ACFYD3_02505 [Candidatus Hypogeohydataceae bacterium YC41]